MTPATVPAATAGEHPLPTTIGTPALTAIGVPISESLELRMESYHGTESRAIGADETARPPVAYTEDLPPTRIQICIDALPGKRAQCVAAAIQMLLTTFIKAERRHELALSPTPLTILQIAGTAGYPKAAVWHTLPIIAAAGLLSWRKLDAAHVEVTWLMSNESEAA